MEFRNHRMKRQLETNSEGQWVRYKGHWSKRWREHPSPCTSQPLLCQKEASFYQQLNCYAKAILGITKALSLLGVLADPVTVWSRGTAADGPLAMETNGLASAIERGCWKTEFSKDKLTIRSFNHFPHTFLGILQKARGNCGILQIGYLTQGHHKPLRRGWAFNKTQSPIVSLHKQFKAPHNHLANHLCMCASYPRYLGTSVPA